MSRLNLSPYDFGKKTHGQVGGKPRDFAYGVDPVASVAQLRRLADEIEKHHVLLQRVEVSTQAGREDFTETRLSLVIIESEEVCPSDFAKLRDDLDTVPDGFAATKPAPL